MVNKKKQKQKQELVLKKKKGEELTPDIVYDIRTMKKDSTISVRLDDETRRSFRLPKKYKEFLENISGKNMNEAVIVALLKAYPTLRAFNETWKLIDAAKAMRLQLKEIRSLQKELLSSGHYMEKAEAKWLENDSIAKDVKETLLSMNQGRRLLNKKYQIILNKIASSLNIKPEEFGEELVTCYICGNPLRKKDACTTKNIVGEKMKNPLFWHKECFGKDKGEIFSDGKGNYKKFAKSAKEVRKEISGEEPEEPKEEKKKSKLKPGIQEAFDKLESGED